MNETDYYLWALRNLPMTVERRRRIKEEVFATVYGGGPDVLRSSKLSSEDTEFKRWLEISRERAVNANRPNPIYGIHHASRRKVWFWRDGSYKIFKLDAAGCVVSDEREQEDVIKMKPSERQAMTEPKIPRAQVVRQQLKALQAEMAHLARFPEDNFANDTVLMVVKTYKRPVPARRPDGAFTYAPYNGETWDKDYTYVLLKANGQWWCTGQNGHQINGASWDAVIEFVDKDDLYDVRTGLSVMTDAGYDDAVTDPEPLQPHRDATEAPANRGDEVLGKFLNPRLKEQES